MLLKSELLNTVKKRIDESKQIPDYSNYVILPNEGLVYSLKNNKFIGSKNHNGYWNCTLSTNTGERWNTKIHRVVWTGVNGPIPQGLDVNHIDENKNNNSIDNLNLLTRKENNNWGSRNERAGKAISKANTNNPKRSKAVGAFKDGKLVLTFPSTQEAERQGYKHSNISNCCKGIRYKTYKGFQWQYL